MRTVAFLLVDDNTTFLRHAALFIEREPCFRVVGTARSIREGVEQAQALRPDVVLLDASMPENNGFEAIPALKRQAPTAHVVMLTSLDEMVYREHAFRLGADGFVSKVDMMETLLPEIHRVVGWPSAPVPPPYQTSTPPCSTPCAVRG